MCSDWWILHVFCCPLLCGTEHWRIEGFFFQNFISIYWSGFGIFVNTSNVSGAFLSSKGWKTLSMT